MGIGWVVRGAFCEDCPGRTTEDEVSATWGVESSRVVCVDDILACYLNLKWMQTRGSWSFTQRASWQESCIQSGHRLRHSLSSLYRQ